MSGVGSVFSGEIAVEGVVGAGWWLVADAGTADGAEFGGAGDEFDGAGAAVDGVDGVAGVGRIVAGPFADRVEAGWAVPADAVGLQVVYGVGRPDGGLTRRPSPQDWAWLAYLGEQLDRLPGQWEAVLTDEDALGTLVVEVAAAVAEAGLALHAEDGALGGAVLVPEPGLGGIVVSWRQHDRMSVEQLHGPAVDGVVQQVMNQALAQVLVARGFEVAAFGGASGHVVRRGT